MAALNEPMFRVAPAARFSEPVLAKLLNPLMPSVEPPPINIVPGLVMVPALIEIDVAVAGTDHALVVEAARAAERCDDTVADGDAALIGDGTGC